MEHSDEIEQLICKAFAAAKSKTVRGLFAFLTKHFAKLRAPGNVEKVLPCVYQVLQLEALSSNAALDVGKHIVRLLERHMKNESDLTIVLHILYQVLTTLAGLDTRLYVGEEVFHMLATLLFESQSKTLNANLLACLQLYIRKYSSINLVGGFWSLFVDKSLAKEVSLKTAQILITLFEEFLLELNDFHCNEHLMSALEKLLFSQSRGERQYGYLLMKKVLSAAIAKTLQPSHIAMLKHNWNLYISLMESLEESRFRDILPSLKAFESNDNRLDDNWTNIIHKRLLTHENDSVIRWTLEYFLRTCTFAELTDEVLLLFLSALNNSELYNIEGYFLPMENIGRFLQCDCSNLFEAISSVIWRAVPLHFWMKQFQLHKKQIDDISTEVLWKLASRVQSLTIPSLRVRTILLVEQIFHTSIDNMELADYVDFVQTLYETSDPFLHLSVFTEKVERCVDLKSVTFSQRFYSTITNNLVSERTEVIEAACQALYKHFAQIPRQQHGWLRLMMVFDSRPSPEKTIFCRRCYRINMNALTRSNLTRVCEELRSKLVWHDSQAYLIHQKSVDFFVGHCLQKFSDIFQNEVKVESLLETGSDATLLKLSELLASHDGELEASVLDNFLLAMKRYSKYERLCNDVVTNLLEFCQKTQTREITQQYADKMLRVNLGNLGICAAVLDAEVDLSAHSYVKGVMLGAAKLGEERIVESYEINVLQSNAALCNIRFWYLNQIKFKHAKDVTDSLLKAHEGLTRKSPWYFINTKHHRIKIRIAYTILYLTYKFGFLYKNCERFWQILLKEENQPNVTYMYEWLVAKFAPWYEVLGHLEKLNTYTKRQQESIVYVAQSWCIRRFSAVSTTILGRIVDFLHPLTTAEDTDIRLCSRLALYHILSNWEYVWGMPRWYGKLRNAIKIAIGEELERLMSEIRLNTYDFFERGVFIGDILMFVTSGPYDEYSFTTVLHGKLCPFTDARSLQESKPTVKSVLVSEDLTVDEVDNTVGEIKTEDTLVKCSFTAYSEPSHN